MKPFVFAQWHVWQGSTHIVCSNEDTKTLSYFKSEDDCINWLFVNGYRDTSRALNKHVKEAPTMIVKAAHSYN